MFNLFEWIPANFFNIFAGNNKFIYADIIFTLFNKMKSMNSYTIYKEEFIDIIENYLTINSVELEEVEQSSNMRNTATFIFRKLKELGWIDVEYDAMQQQMVNFEDYAISILNTLLELNKDHTFELSSKVYSMYNNLKNMDVEHGYLTIYTVYEQAHELIDKLKSLNSNIRKYIKKMITLNQKDETTYLRSILTQLLGDYKEKVIDQAYYYMKTNDNPRKYKNATIELCKKIKNNSLTKMKIIKQIQEKDGIDPLEATEKFFDLLDYIENSFDEIISLMTMIDDKNAKYINVAIDKIKIIMNHNTDIEGCLLQILKNFNLLKEDIKIHFMDNRNIIPTSLYTMRVKRKQITTQELNQNKIEYSKEELLSSIKSSIKYSKRNIQKYIMEKLEKKENIELQDFNLSVKEEFIKMLLVIIYANDDSSGYQIIWKQEKIQTYGYTTRKFIIERKK